jgi:hypothetical protein
MRSGLFAIRRAWPNAPRMRPLPHAVCLLPAAAWRHALASHPFCVLNLLTYASAPNGKKAVDLSTAFWFQSLNEIRRLTAFGRASIQLRKAHQS